MGWLQSREVACAWLSLDTADNDLSRFTRHLSTALRTVRPAVADATADLFGPGATPSPELVGASLVEGLTESDDPYVLVIDDYGEAEPLPETRADDGDDKAADPATARFDFGLESLLDGLGARVRA